MKIATFFFCFLFGIAYSHSQNKTKNFIQKNIESCRIPINDSLSVYHIHEKLYNNDIKLVLKTENVLTKECLNYNIADEHIKKADVFINPIIKINNWAIGDISLTGFTNLIPKRISALKKINYTVIIIELYSFSYSTIGSGYIYLCFKVGTKGNVIENKILELKEEMKTNRYNKIF
ncbi:hypothetical protein OIU80_00940 [Flavobacterium sp. LS1R47]|uniref:Uncharacterized protein n=1 Tax=Flavobacterium frigoritolerans TaxID=2987686 RepID=A0A9X3BZW0_9FLAO|nr:hypothetical protein [Flavobacterium frigoritolerans]MCV9930835.1 hypothetical protein [Flavobacterium frigoritolerans]